MKAAANRNHMMDAMKAVAALGVILVHYQFPGAFGRITCSVGVVGVVLFFLLSGYQCCCDDPAQSEKILVRFRRNLTLTVIAVGVHLAFTVAEQLLLGTFGSWAATWLANPVTYVRMVILGDFGFIHGDHIWYMVAMLYGYLILYCMEKYRLQGIFYKLLPLLLLLRICMETYTNSFSHFAWLDWHFSGNFLVGGLPAMLLGSYIRRREEKLLASSAKVFLWGMAVSLALVFVTVNVKVWNMDISQPFKIAAAAGAFLLCLKVPLDRPVPLLAKLGGRYNLHIYLWHFLLGILLRHLLETLGAGRWVMDWCLPVLVMLAAVALAKLLTDRPRKAPRT